MIVTHPQGLQHSIVDGSDVTFTVIATGTQLSYQWQKNGINIFNTANTYSGTTTATLTILSVTAVDSGQYRVSVSNSAGSVISNQASLTFGKYFYFIRNIYYTTLSAYSNLLSTT